MCVLLTSGHPRQVKNDDYYSVKQVKNPRESPVEQVKNDDNNNVKQVKNPRESLVEQVKTMTITTSSKLKTLVSRSSSK